MTDDVTAAARAWDMAEALRRGASNEEVWASAADEATAALVAAELAAALRRWHAHIGKLEGELAEAREAADELAGLIDTAPVSPSAWVCLPTEAD